MKKAEAFYTGGGIWISAKYISDDIYVTIDNDWYEDTLTYYDHKQELEEGWDDEYNFYSVIRQVPLEEMNEEELELYKELKEELDKEIARCG